MAQIFDTTLVPSKLELITEWLARQSWYPRPGAEPQLQPVGGFRLDDPDGDVGIEVHFVRDSDSTVYQVPLTYRGAALEGTTHDGPASAFVGTMEHGVLGTRYVYDGPHDPVYVAQLVALVVGDAEPQAQRESDTPDPTVVAAWQGSTHPASGPIRHVEHRDGETLVHVGGAPGEPSTTVLRIVRLLQSEEVQAPHGTHEAAGVVRAGWTGPGDTKVRGPVALLS
jgi:hypothetical protein